MKELKSIYGKSELKDKCDKIREEEKDFYSSVAKTRRKSKPGVLRKLFMYATFGTAILGISMATGVVKTEDVKGVYDKIKSIVVGEETSKVKYETIENKVKGGN